MKLLSVVSSLLSVSILLFDISILACDCSEVPPPSITQLCCEAFPCTDPKEPVSVRFLVQQTSPLSPILVTAEVSAAIPGYPGPDFSLGTFTGVFTDFLLPSGPTPFPPSPGVSDWIQSNVDYPTALAAGFVPNSGPAVVWTVATNAVPGANFNLNGCTIDDPNFNPQGPWNNVMTLAPNTSPKFRPAVKYQYTASPTFNINNFVGQYVGARLQRVIPSSQPGETGSAKMVCKLRPFSRVCGDPQFVGFLGQTYQVHGTSNADYNIISSPNFQFNAHFDYLSSGSCRPGTDCFSHPGNYFTSIALLVRDEQRLIHHLLIESGPVDVGLSVTLNDSTCLIGKCGDHFNNSLPLTIGSYTFTFLSAFVVSISSPEFVLRIQNSDRFLNQDVSLGDGLMKQISAYKVAEKTNDPEAAIKVKSLPHGLLGQTWRQMEYQNRWKYIEGQLFDYLLADGLMGKEFMYNRF